MQRLPTTIHDPAPDMTITPISTCFYKEEVMTMDKEKYLTPDMEIVEFEAEDIIITSYEDDETKLIK